jgi:hypothetical protein
VLEEVVKDPDIAMIVGTRTADDVRTSIRVGGAGLAKAYSRLAASCTK